MFFVHPRFEIVMIFGNLVLINDTKISIYMDLNPFPSSLAFLSLCFLLHSDLSISWINCVWRWNESLFVLFLLLQGRIKDHPMIFPLFVTLAAMVILVYFPLLGDNSGTWFQPL